MPFASQVTAAAGTYGIATSGDDGTTAIRGHGVTFFSSTAQNIDYRPSGKFTIGGTPVAAGSAGGSSGLLVIGAIAIGVVGLFFLLRR